ncbi:MAG: endonuclease III domain-containing protein [Patescibacteria group bacterium]
MAASNKIFKLYLDFLQKHGSPEKFWPQWCALRKSPKQRELIAIGAILTQRTSWHNADLSLRNLKKAGLLSLKKVSDLDNYNQLRELIRPAGFYQSKPRRLYDFCSFIIKEYSSLEKFMKEDLKIAREKLLSLYGIGPETADTILLYALDRLSFVIDEYTKRLVKKRGLATSFTYDYLKDFFERNLPQEVKAYQEFHALIIVEEKGKASSIMKRV